MAPDTPTIALQTHALSTGYNNPVLHLLENMSLTLHAGELVCLMGPNGVGKSTLMRTLAGLQRPLAGSVTLEGRPGMPPEHQVAVVLTEKIAGVNMTVYELVTFGRYPYLDWNMRLREEDKKIIGQAISQTRIHGFTHKKLYELSDGQLQLVMIARALAQDTAVILLDEPTAHLDLNNRVEIMKLLQRLARETGKAILVATHELDLALQTADILWVAGKDKTLLTGLPEDLVLQGTLDEIFQLKGYDLKTGQIYHTAFRNKTVALHGEGYLYRWTRNALERNGYNIAASTPTDVTLTIEPGDRPSWQLQQGTATNVYYSLGELLKTLPK